VRAPIVCLRGDLGSWMRLPEENGRPLSYRETAPRLAGTSSAWALPTSNFCPIMEHPSLLRGYQTTGTSRRPPATARLRISCIWWTISISMVLE